MSTRWMRDYLKYDSLAWDDVSEGDELPAAVREVDATLVVVGAIASRDLYPVHHDRDVAQRSGAPDVFMNILTTNGLVGRYVTDWAGPGARLVDVDIRLGAPNYPGDTMVMRGRVTEVDRVSGTVVVGLRGSNRIGDHVTGVVRLVLPAPGAPAPADSAGSGRNGTSNDGHEERT